MKYNFNSTSLIVGYIKELLRDFNLPVYTVYRKDKPLYEGKIYIKGNSVIKIKDGKETILANYDFNKPVSNAINNFIINSSYYDIPTHNYLGNYLRFIRDYKGINLMPLYNCFNTEKPIGLNYTLKIKDLTKKSESSEVDESIPIYFNINTDDKNYNYYIIPAKFNENYTIAIDSSTPIEMACIIYTGDEVLNISKELTRKTYKKYPGVSFLNPIHYDTNINAGEEVRISKSATTKAPYYKFESNLRILIKIPKVVKSSITVLEGYYNNNLILGSVCSTYAKPDAEENGSLVASPTILSLLRLNDGESYPFADRLVEYLLGNAITSDEKIKHNIGRLQDQLYTASKPLKGFYDVWNDELRKDLYDFEKKPVGNLLYDIYKKDTTTKVYSKLRFLDVNYDLLAYGDKDLEYFLDTAKQGDK